MANQAHAPSNDTRTIALTMTLAGVPAVRIAKAMNINRSTLLKYYRTELTGGQDRANALVAGKLYQLCQQGDRTALIFWAKTQMGWREVDRGDVNVAVGVQVNTGIAAPSEEAWLEEIQQNIIEANARALEANDTQAES